MKKRTGYTSSRRLLANYRERHTERLCSDLQWKNRLTDKQISVHNSSGCPAEHEKRLFLCVSCSWKLSQDNYFIFGKVTAIDMYKLYISEVSGQSSPSPPTFFTLHLDRERLRWVKTWMDVNTWLEHNRMLWDQSINTYCKSAYGLANQRHIFLVLM